MCVIVSICKSVLIMSELKICRICLRTEANVYKYDQYQLKSFYEEILEQKVNLPDELPHYFCFECATMIHKFHKFKEKCYFGHKILKEMLLKGPDGKNELLKLSRQLNSNNEISRTISATITGGQSEYSENSFNETTIDTSESPKLNNELNATDTLQIDSFFMQNPEINLSIEEQTNENVMPPNICNKTSDGIKLTESDNGYVVESDLNKHTDEDCNVEESPTIVYYDLPNGTETLLESGLEFVEIGLDPTEYETDTVTDNSVVCSEVPQEIDETLYEEINLEATVSTVDVNNMNNTDETQSTPLILCQAPDSSQEFQETNTVSDTNDVNDASNNNITICVENNAESEPTAILFCEPSNTASNLDLSVDNNQSLPIVFYEVSSETQEFTQPVLGYLATKLDLSGENNVAIIHNSGSAEKKLMKIDNFELLSTCDDTDVDKNVNKGNNSDKLKSLLVQNELSITAELQIKSNDVDKVKITSKNQLTPNIHSVVPTTSQEYFECNNELDPENIDSEDTLNRIHLESCTKVEQVKKKRVRDRRKFPFNKKVKPNPCHKKCHNRCTTRVTEVERTIIHENYWKMDKRRQQEWLLSCIRPKRIGRRQGVSNIKNITYNYVLNQGGKDIRVCQQFLMKTLDISQMRFRYAISKLLNVKDLKKDLEKKEHKGLEDSDSSFSGSEDFTADSQ